VKSRLEELKPLLESQYGVEQIGIFGSFVRGEQEEKSDLDVLVAFEDPVGFFELIRLEDELSERLGVDIDLVTKDSLKPRIQEHVLDEVAYA
jgi:predicted nucleotidyltransferase